MASPGGLCETHGVGDLKLVLGTVGTLALDQDVLARSEVGEVRDRELVRARDEVVVLLLRVSVAIPTSKFNNVRGP